MIWFQATKHGGADETLDTEIPDLGKKKIVIFLCIYCSLLA